jgi:hypothetical protein
MQPIAFRLTFGGGINTKIDDKTVPVTELLRAENVVFDKLTSLRRRNGYEALSPAIDGSTEELTGAIKMGVRDRERLTFTADRCFSRLSEQDKWSDVGAAFSVLGRERPLVHAGTQQSQPDQAEISGITLAAWEDSLGGVWWSVVDGQGHVLRDPTQADALGISPRCVAVGGNLHLYYATAVTGRLWVVVVNPLAPSASVTPAILTDDLDPTSPTYDACPTTRINSPALIVWCERGTSSFRLGYVDRSGILGGPLNGNPSVASGGVGVMRIAGSSPIAIAFWFVNGNNNDSIATAHIKPDGTAAVFTWTAGSIGIPISNNGGLNVYSGISVQRITIAFTSASTVWVAAEETAAQPSNHFVVTVTAPNPAVGSIGPRFTIRSVGLVSRAFAINSDAFAVFVHDTSFFNSYFTFRLSDFAPVGRHATARASGLPPRKHLSSANVIDNVVSIGLPFRERVLSATGTEFREAGIRIFTMDFDSTDTHQIAQFGAGLYMGGACPLHYDGRLWTELGFHVGPELIVATPAGGGSLTSTTTYEYRSWYEYTDTQGEVHLGPTSAGTIVTMGGADTQVTLTLPTLRITQKSHVRIGVARSFAAKTGKTAQLLRVTSGDPSTAGAVNGIVFSNPAVDTVSFVDRMSDVTLANQEEIYTDGGILSNDPSPFGHVIVRHRDRLLYNDPSNPYVLRYTQSIDDGFGVEAPPDLSFTVDPFGGAITAAASQDDRAIIWQERAIRLFAGDGPLANGDTASSGFTTPQLVTSDVGCSNPASIVLTPRGYMFQASGSKGIYNIGTDGSTLYIGAPVESFNTQTITRAVLLPNRTAVLFLTDAGQSLIFDYQRMAWSTATNHEGLDAIVVDDQLYYLRTDGSTVYRETVGEYSDAGSFIPVIIATAHIKMQEYLQGFCKFNDAHLIGQWLSPHQLGVQYGMDYTPQLGDPIWLDATGDTSSDGWITGLRAQKIGTQPILGTAYGDGDYGEGPYGGVPDDVYQWRMQLLEKGEAIQFIFTDFQKSGSFGPGFELSEILITGGVKGPAPKPFTKGRSI